MIYISTYMYIIYKRNLNYLNTFDFPYWFIHLVGKQGNWPSSIRDVQHVLRRTPCSWQSLHSATSRPTMLEKPGYQTTVMKHKITGIHTECKENIKNMDQETNLHCMYGIWSICHIKASKLIKAKDYSIVSHVKYNAYHGHWSVLLQILFQLSMTVGATIFDTPGIHSDRQGKT